MAEALANWFTSAFRHSKNKRKDENAKRYEKDKRTGRRGSLPYQYGCEWEKELCKGKGKKKKREEEQSTRTVDDEDSGHDNDGDDESEEENESNYRASRDSLRRRAVLERLMRRGSKRQSTRSSSKRTEGDCDSIEESWERFLGGDDEYAVDYADIYRMQRILRMRRDSDDITLGFLPRRAFSDSDLIISNNNNDDSSDRGSVCDRYGLIDFDDEYYPFRGTVCVPDGVVVGDYECKLEPEFFENLAEHMEQEYGTPPKKNSQPTGRTNKGVLAAQLAPKSSDPTGGMRSRSPSPTPEWKDSIVRELREAPLLPKKVTSALGSLRRSLGIGKWRKDSSMDEDEWEEFRQRCTHGRRRDRGSAESGTTTGSGDTAKNSFDGRKSLGSGLPDDLAFLSPTGSGPAMDFEDGQQEPQSRIQLDSPLWSRFGLFDDDEYNSWSKKFRIDHLTQKDVLRQDKIFELIIAEKKHCANLAFLKQAYRARFMEDCQELSLSPKDVDSLVPDVLDAMLQFHLHLLDRLVQRQKEGEQVYTIADIVEEELSERGKHTSIAVQAYTTFGANKEESEKYFDRLKKSALFRKYLEDLVASDPWYRKFEKFKTLLTKIMAHSTRYHMILEDIRKNDTEESRKVANLKAVEAAKGFALRIDHALSVSHMTRKWEAIRREMDWGAKTMLATNNAACPLVDFLMSDLRSDTGAGVDGRKIMCIGDVTMKNNGEKIIGDNSCLLILFDDILVFLQRRQHKITFFPQEQAVFAVSSLHARSMERGWSAHILSSSFKPMLMELQFPNKSDRAKWMSVFEKAIQRAPKQVRMPARKEGEAAKERELEEKRQKQAEDEWMKKLEKMFEERKGSENVVADYIEKRMEWFDQLRGHINSMPFKGRSDLPEKVKAGVRQRFRELRQSRVEPISKLISKCTTARDHDLLDFFDDAAELNNLESDSGSDSSTSESKNLPRRVQTFHGTTTPKREKGSFRRHTTVPKMNSLPQSSSSHGNLDEVMRREAREDMENGGGEESGDEKERERDEEISAMTHRLPLGMHLKARRAATHLIKENVSLRTEISYLKNELGLNKTRLSLLERSRCVPGQALAGPAVPPSETLEALRKKEQELRDGETKFRQREEEMAEKQKTLEARVQKSETELAERWRVLLEREGKGGNVVNNLHSSTNPSGNVRGTTPSSPSTTSSGMGTMGPPLGVTAGVPPLRGGTLPSGAKPISPALMSLSEKVQTKKKK